MTGLSESVALGEFLTESAQYYGRRLVVHANMERIDFKGLTVSESNRWGVATVRTVGASRQRGLE
jgi:hypothetical protein